MNEKDLKYWLIFLQYGVRLSKPFSTIDGLDKFINENNNAITIIARTETIKS